MKEIVTYGDKSGKYYEVNINGSYKKFATYDDAKYYKKQYYGYFDPVEESEEDKIARLAREKAIERDLYAGEDVLLASTILSGLTQSTCSI